MKQKNLKLLIALSIFIPISCSKQKIDEEKIYNNWTTIQSNVKSGKYDMIWTQKIKFEDNVKQVIATYYFYESDSNIRKTISITPPQYYYFHIEDGAEIIKKDSIIYYFDNAYDYYYKFNYDSTIIYYDFTYYEEMLALLHDSKRFMLLKKIIKSIHDDEVLNNSIKINTKIKTINVYNSLESSNFLINEFNTLYIDTSSCLLNKFEIYYDTNEIAGNSIYYNSFEIKNQINNDTSIKNIITNRLNEKLLKLKFKSTEMNFNILDKIFKIQNEEQIDQSLVNNDNVFEIAFELLNGKKIKLSDLKGKYVLLDFWYIHCPPCMEGVPKLNKIYEKYKNKNFEIIAINTIDKNIKTIADVAQKRKMLYKVGVGTKEFEKYFEIKYFPTYILLHPSQKKFDVIELNNDIDLNVFYNKIDNFLK